MPGDRFPIDAVVQGEYMKWSIVEAEPPSALRVEAIAITAELEHFPFRLMGGSTVEFWVGGFLSRVPSAAWCFTMFHPQMTPSRV